MRWIVQKVRQWLGYDLVQRDLELRAQELKTVLELNLQEIRRVIAAQSADHVQTLSALGLLIADQKGMLQFMRERDPQLAPPGALGVHISELRSVLEFNLQEIRRDIAAQSADHVQTLSAFGLLIADQKAMLQFLKEREPQRDPLITLEAHLNELQSAIEKHSTDYVHTLSAIGLLIADQKALLKISKDMAIEQGRMKQTSHTETSKDDYA